MTKAGPTMSFGRRLLSAALAFHLASVLIWLWPVHPAARRVVSPYLLYTGLWQAWDMFAPNPLSINVYLNAQVTMADGSTRTWPFPRMEGMGLWDKFRNERFRKWATDHVRLDSRSEIWPATARYIARLHASEPAGPPRSVVLMRHWRVIPPPTALWIPTGLEQVVPENDYVFFRYTVRAEDLQRTAVVR